MISVEHSYLKVPLISTMNEKHLFPCILVHITNKNPLASEQLLQKLVESC